MKANCLVSVISAKAGSYFRLVKCFGVFFFFFHATPSLENLLLYISNMLNLDLLKGDI